MLVSIIRRLVQASGVVFAMTLIVFIGVNIIGNPVDIMINPDANHAERLRVIQSLGLDQPLWIQYVSFLRGIVHGNFGDSFVYKRPAFELILNRLPATVELALAALLIALVVGLPPGDLCRAASHQTRIAPDHERFDSGIFPAHLLGGIDADPAVRGESGVAAVKWTRLHPLFFWEPNGLF